MKIGLIDVDAVNNGTPKFPNLALMRISAYHKARADDVEWWWSDFIHYDIVYMSKIFSDTYSPDVPEPMNADNVIKGGTGYCIQLVGGRSVRRNEEHEIAARNGEDVPGLFHLSAIRFCREYDKPWMPVRMFLLPCCREGRTMFSKGR